MKDSSNHKTNECVKYFTYNDVKNIFINAG